MASSNRENFIHNINVYASRAEIQVTREMAELYWELTSNVNPDHNKENALFYVIRRATDNTTVAEAAAGYLNMLWYGKNNRSSEVSLVADMILKFECLHQSATSRVAFIRCLEDNKNYIVLSNIIKIMTRARGNHYLNKKP